MNARLRELAKAAGAIAFVLVCEPPAGAAPDLRVPEGFEIFPVTTAAMVARPICADLDPLGRLYVAESSGSNEKVQVQLEKKPHRILRLEDSDGDGIYDKRIVFADKMMLPEGILWHDGAVYCGAPPSIWKLEDTDGDGVADRRSEWFKGGTLTGCANDIHGPYAGPNGFLYWCKGAFAKQTHERPGRKPISDSAAHIFRCKPDGSHFDSFISGGMDNPVEIAWSEDGDLFFTTTFFNNPRGGKRDAIVNGVYGAVYPKVHGVLDGLTRTGELMPAMTHLGPAAPCGLTCYKSSVFGPGFRGNLFCCQFNTHKVSRHILQPHGSTFTTIDSDFVTSDSPDFHPTDVLPDADGSLLVIDTGGWYKLCCPTSQLAKPEVPGGIYRVRRVGPVEAEPEPEAKKKWPPVQRSPIERLGHPSPHARLTAASVCAMRPDKAAVPAILAATGEFMDRQLEHALIYALIVIGDPAATAEGLKAEHSGTRRAALIALDQMDGTEAPADALRAALDSGIPTLRDAAWWIYEQRPGRAGELVDYFKQHPGELGRMAKFAGNESLRAVLEQSLAAALASRDETRLADALPIIKSFDAKSRAGFVEKLAAISRDETIAPERRIEAIGLLPAPVPTELFLFLHGQNNPRAALQLARINLGETQRGAIIGSLPAADPLQLPHLVRCFQGQADPQLGKQLVAALAKAKSLPSLPQEVLAEVLKNFPEEVRKLAQSQLGEKRESLVDQAARLEKLVADLPEGDVARGHLVFNSSKAACFSCHAIGYRGGDLGPGLSRIGSIRSERDLLEAIVFPSASFVRSYEPVVVTARDGTPIAGIVRDQSAENLTLGIGPGVSKTIARADVTKIDPGTISLMPAGLDQQLSLRELADLVAFLKSMR